MGGGPPLALGLAMSQPTRHIIALVGDGSLLMNFGALVTLRAAGAENLTLVLLDNGVYEATGVQPTPAAGIELDYAEVARACRWPTAASFCDLEIWQADCARLLRASGPRFFALCVAPVTQDVVPPSPGPIVPRMAALRAALGVGDAL
jgi:thiamine pyrophosphate-dependent acetolactate synthase large subunit-like protein